MTLNRQFSPKRFTLTHLVACDVLHLTGEGDVAADPDGVVGHGLEEGRALAAEPAALPERGVGRAAWQQQDRD